MEPELDDARIACLKQIFGDSLGADEQRKGNDFERTPEGRAFAEQSREMRRLLSRFAGVTIPTPRADVLRERFESLRREQARQLLRRGVPFCLGVCAIFAAGGLVLTMLASGTPHAAGIHNVWILMGGGALVACVAVLMHAARIVSTPDLTGLLTQAEKQAGSHLGLNVRTIAVLAIAAALIRPMFGWGTAFLIALTLLVVMRVTVLASRRFVKSRRMRSDEEMWAWWYADEARPSQ